MRYIFLLFLLITQFSYSQSKSNKKQKEIISLLEENHIELKELRDQCKRNDAQLLYTLPGNVRRNKYYIIKVKTRVTGRLRIYEYRINLKNRTTERLRKKNKAPD